MFKTSVATLVVVLATVSLANAQGRPSSVAMTCAEARGLVLSRGTVVLGMGGHTYDRFVSDRRFCQPTEATQQAFAPTRDMQSCPVGYTCIVPYDRGVDSNR